MFFKQEIMKIKHGWSFGRSFVRYESQPMDVCPYRCTLSFFSWAKCITKANKLELAAKRGSIAKVNKSGNAIQAVRM
jgi:hypothetical protein